MEQYEKDYLFQKKGKKYKTKYFHALGELFGGMDAKETDGNKGMADTSGISEVGKAARIIIDFDS